MGQHSSRHRKRTNIHWDIVLNQTQHHGGGKIWFDDVLMRENGEFVPAELQGLNLR
jgi:aminopeptidase